MTDPSDFPDQALMIGHRCKRCGRPNMSVSADDVCWVCRDELQLLAAHVKGFKPMKSEAEILAEVEQKFVEAKVGDIVELSTAETKVLYANHPTKEEWDARGGDT